MEEFVDRLQRFFNKADKRLLPFVIIFSFISSLVFLKDLIVSITSNDIGAAIIDLCITLSIYYLILRSLLTKPLYEGNKE